jgi:pSer/pThr/pTyr-binding forkhead associated (FHA) protein
VKTKKERKTNEPYITNLNEDPMLSYVICHFISNQVTTIGNHSKNSIQLNGIAILEKHATIVISNKNEIIIEPAHNSAHIKVNGIDINGPKILEHKDRVLFGNYNTYIKLFFIT